MKKPQPPPLSHQHPFSFHFLEKSGVQCINNGRNAFQDFPEIARILFLHLNLQEQKCITKHILVFSTANNIRLLAAMKTWGMDVTFKYQHLFTIHVFAAAKLVPTVYCLCTDKDIGTYGFIFQALISRTAALEVDLDPDTIICNFETALIPAIQGYFQNARIQGCYLNFFQAVHRKVGELGL
ncbi:hypothetical protein T4E_693 [Trichinella pseudospiralis]|uniref:Uncharacterized protein n=1 Tax=Trichinella pseudospiralis TaxID=6337 RepID=A0A0V0XFB2_TRIPS|nr:hypothetical protein T4E_693 [Trichinella pseudospiralis]